MLPELLSTIGLVSFGVVLTLAIVFFPQRIGRRAAPDVAAEPATAAAPPTPPADDSAQTFPHAQEVNPDPVRTETPAPEQPFFTPGEDYIEEPNQDADTAQADKILDIAKNMLTMAIHESVRMSHDEQRSALVLEQLSNLEKQFALQQETLSEFDRGLHILSKQLTALREDSVVIRPNEPIHAPRNAPSKPAPTQPEPSAPADKQPRVRPAPRPSTSTISPVTPT